MKIFKYIREYKKFRDSGYDSIETLIKIANETPPPIHVTKLKAGEVIESAYIGIREPFSPSISLDISIGDDKDQ
jgi:hypothetical protein